MGNISFKLIFRSWWRNKAFAVISILSLAVGIACTNLLAAFVIHEYNVEAGNPNRDRIYCIVQDYPFKSGSKVFFSGGDILPKLKDDYPEVEDYLSVSSAQVRIDVGETIYNSIEVLSAGSSFTKFFPYQTIAGSLEEALSDPNKIALAERTATRFFGKENPIGKTLLIRNGNAKVPVEVAAIIKEYDQSYLSFDAITFRMQASGGTAFLLMNKPVDMEAFAMRIKKDGILSLSMTMEQTDGRYYFYTLQENYFKKYDDVQTSPYLNNQNRTTLGIGFFSALLILLIACFNYINLNFSRLLQQVKMIHVQRLMGASRTDIGKQLFCDIFFTVTAAFLISLLMMYDLVPVFNSILSGQMGASFIFSRQVIPVLVGLILVLSVIPAVYVSRKITSMSRRHYFELSGGKGKRSIIALLSIAQFTISIVLIIATLTVNKQMKLISRGGDAYRGLIEIGNWAGSGNSNIKAFVAELRSHPELGEISVTGVSILNSGLRTVVVPDKEGNDTNLSLFEFYGNVDFLSMFKIGLLQGMPPEEATAHYSHPVYINRRFADVLVGKGENPVGQLLKDNPVTTIAGIVDDFFTTSLEETVPPAVIHITDEMEDNYNVYFRLDGNHPGRLGTVKQIWEKHNPGELFASRDVYREFITRNHKAFELGNLLLMYSLISIFLTCFGLFGMALYSTEQRTKEIGIRKVNGATVWQIVGLLNKRFLLWIGIAFLIAAPIAWILLSRWLQSFVYRTDISIGVFLLALLAVAAVALLTVSWHSYRAASSNPVDALRDE